MEIFVTGATGYLGSALTAELTRAGHRVTALNRSPEKVPLLNALGAISHPGDLLDPTSYREVAGAAAAVVHAAFDYTSVLDGDRVALDTLLAATADRDAIVVYTSGCWVVGDTGGRTVGDDASTEHPASIVTWRVAHEQMVLGANTERRRAAVVRPGIVYGRAGGLTARMFETGTNTGAAEFVGDGENHWSLVHVDDLARLYRIVIERGAGVVYQAVDGVPLTVARVATAASRAAGAGGSIRPVPVERARERIGPVADAMCLDQRLAAPNARQLGWVPERPSFEAAAAHAFEEWRRAAADRV